MNTAVDWLTHATEPGLRNLDIVAADIAAGVAANLTHAQIVMRLAAINRDGIEPLYERTVVDMGEDPLVGCGWPAIPEELLGRHPAPAAERQG